MGGLEESIGNLRASESKRRLYCQRGETGILNKGVDRERKAIREAIERGKSAAHQPRVLYQVVEAERESERHPRSEEVESNGDSRGIDIQAIGVVWTCTGGQ